VLFAAILGPGLGSMQCANEAPFLGVKTFYNVPITAHSVPQLNNTFSCTSIRPIVRCFLKFGLRFGFYMLKMCSCEELTFK
jgi:hypothetical protein